MVEELDSGDYVTASVRLLRPLAQGGMGKVWVAEHLVLDTKVVVKLMSKEMEGLAGAADRFAREAAVAAQVKSPHVVQVFDSGVTGGGVTYIVMELLEGHDLGAELAARGRMAPSEVAVVIGQLGKALASAHRAGVIHRDIKPDNVFLCEVEGGEPFVKLLDFGTAKDEAHAPNTTTQGQLIGTPYYMSPEQILGEEIDVRTDIWSLGVVAFEALTGTRPFEGVTVGAITLAIHATRPRLTSIVPELPVALDDWFAQACARDPADRFQTARAAANALALAISGEAAPSTPESSARSLVDPTPRLAPHSAESSARHPAMVASVATSLSSTLSSTRQKERRTMMWLAGAVVVCALIGMTALLTSDPDRHATLPDQGPTMSAMPTTAPSPPASQAPAPSHAPAPPPPSAPIATPIATPRPTLAPLPPTHPPPTSASASASTSASASAPASASASASASPPDIPTAPLDLHELLPTQ
jgi:eukaryotic-like serine/threonine-protein kinase